MVEAAFRPAGEGPRSLLDFVDEQGVETMRDGLKELIRESKVLRRVSELKRGMTSNSNYRKRKLISIHPYYPLMTTSAALDQQ
jgi:hypothetical protein